MGFFQGLQPRRFRYLPKFHQPEDEDRIRFRRITVYDPHERSSMPWLYIAIAVLVGLLIMIMGGIRNPARPPVLTVDDVVQITHEAGNK